MAELEAMTAAGTNRRHRGPNPALAAGCLGVLLAAAACSGEDREPAPRTIAAPVVEMDWPEGFGEVERPLVEFQHRKHTEALGQEGCGACHPRDNQNRYRPVLARDTEPADRDGLIDAYHQSCIGCHQERLDRGAESGPVDCGGCHVPRPPARSLRLPMRFDYALHARHVAATGGEKECGVCHHVYDEEAKKLVVRQGTESSCWDCHLDQDEGRILSRRNAAHLDCINCHLDKRDEKKDSGPWLCAGCHSANGQSVIEPPEKIARLDRGQPDVLWVKKPPRAGTRRVPFDHAFHESPEVTRACRDCHHRTLRPCRECHTLSGAPEGGGVTLEQAFHARDSTWSCVGCHLRQTARPACAGCHHELPHPPGRHSCTVCHAGPPPGEEQDASARPVLAEVRPVELPPVSEQDFPAWLTVEAREQFQQMPFFRDLAQAYQPTDLPHLEIVQSLHSTSARSRLATRFHHRAAILCAGCHHHTPLDERPPPCSACHAADPDPNDDKPELLAAFHRQCIGCHQQMGIKARGCEDCHPRRKQGGAP